MASAAGSVLDPYSNNAFRSADPIGGGIWNALHPGDPVVDNTAENTYANLTRNLWGDYMTTIGAPQENNLIDYATNPDTVSNSMKQASTDTNAAFDQQAKVTQNRLSGLGLALSPDEQAAATRDTALSRSLADVGSQNSARDQTVARQQAILGGAPAITLGSS